MFDRVLNTPLKGRFKIINKKSGTTQVSSYSSVFIVYLEQVFAGYRSSHQRCIVKKMFLKISRNSQKIISAGVSFLNNCFWVQKGVPAGNYMFEVNNRNPRTGREICSKLTIKMSLLLTLNILHTLFQCFCCYI